jgi:dipeptidyl aminopeptidase/acylaminoacyl peptidase
MHITQAKLLRATCAPGMHSAHEKLLYLSIFTFACNKNFYAGNFIPGEKYHVSQNCKGFPRKQNTVGVAGTIACVALVAWVSAAPREAPSALFEGIDLFGLQWASNPQIRPDGRVVAYVRSSYDLLTDKERQSIWLIDVQSKIQTPLLSNAVSDFSPTWSPDGTRLAYISISAAGRAQLFVNWLATGSSSRIADLAGTPKSLSWSQDGKYLAFTMFVPEKATEFGSAPPKPEGANWAPPLEVITDLNYQADGAGRLKPGFTHAFIVAADGGASRQLTFGAFNEAGPISWSPNGEYLYLAGNRDADWVHEQRKTQIYQVAVSNGAVTPLTSQQGPAGAPEVSPDGSKIAYLGYVDRFLSIQNVELYVMNRDGSNQQSLTGSLDRSIETVRWADDGRSLYVMYVDKSTTRVARVSLTGRVEPVAEGLTSKTIDRPSADGEFSIARNGTTAYTAGTPTSPSDISVARDGHVTRLTNLNEELFRGKALGQVTKLVVTSSFDHEPVDAWLVTPPNFDPAKKYPLILEIHGGPFGAYGPVFSTDCQLYAAAGYIVLYANERASTSYGEKFANLVQYDYPGVDYDDLMSTVDAAIARGFVDPDNLFVTGGSAGGLMTAWIVGKTDRFRAAAAQKPVINWTSTTLTTDIYTQMPKYWFRKPPWEDPDSYWKHSPLSLVGAVKTPTLVVVGDQDLRTPISESEQYYQALLLRGIPTALIKVPGASHGTLTARPSQSAAKASAILAWFEKYRKRGG